MSISKKNIFAIVTILYFLSALLFVTDGFTKYYHLIDAVFLAFFVIDVLSRPKKIQIYFLDNLYASSLLVFSIFLVTSFFWSPNTDGFLTNILLQSSLILNSIALFYFVHKYNLIKYILYSYIVFALINNLICLRIISNSFFSSQDAFENIRFIGTGLGPNNLAIDLLFSIFVTLLLIIYTKNIIIRNFCIINILLTIYSILWTQSRKGLIFTLILIMIVMCYYFFNYHKKKIRNIIFLLGIIAVTTFCLKDVIFEAAGPAFERLKGLFSLYFAGYGDDSAEVRNELIKIGWNNFADKFFVGHGQNAFSYYYYTYSHNNFIELLYNLGIVGFVLYYLMFVRFFNKIRNYFSEQRILFAGICLILIIMDNALISYNLRSYMLFLTFLSVMLTGRWIRLLEQGFVRRKPTGCISMRPTSSVAVSR